MMQGLEISSVEREDAHWECEMQRGHVSYHFEKGRDFGIGSAWTSNIPLEDEEMT